MTSSETYKIFDNKSSLGKFLFLGVIALALCRFTLLAFLAPVPLIMAFLLYGRKTGMGLVAVSLGLIWALTAVFHVPLYLAGLYLVSFVYALLISEVIHRNVKPDRGLLYVGTSLFAILMTVLIVVNFKMPMMFKNELSGVVNKAFAEFKVQNKEILNTGTEEALQMKEFIETPEKTATEIYNNIPALVFVSVFLGIWISFFVTLRNSRIWRYKVFYQFTLKDLINFKAPEHLIWLLIIGLVLYVGADYGLSEMAEIAGTNLLGCLAVLYFFHGFGVYYEFLSFLKTGRFMRIMLTSFAVIFAWKLLIVVGIFDLWFDFRKFFKKQNSEGDKI